MAVTPCISSSRSISSQVLDHALERVDELVFEQRDRVLGQSAGEDVDGVGLVQLVAARGREDVDHAGRDAAVGHDADPALARSRVEFELTEYDLGIAAHSQQWMPASIAIRVPSKHPLNHGSRSVLAA